MNGQSEVVTREKSEAGMGLFERWLTLWVGLCIIAGIGLGHIAPAHFKL